MQIEIKLGDVLDQAVDGIVHPTNSFCQFATGFSRELLVRAGDVVARELGEHAPVAVGAAVVTSAGALPARHVVHVPTVDEPGQRVHAENVRRAARAALLAAHRCSLATLAIPGLSTEKTGVAPDAMTRAIIEELGAHRHACPQAVLLVDLDPVVVENFRLSLAGHS